MHENVDLHQTAGGQLARAKGLDAIVAHQLQEFELVIKSHVYIMAGQTLGCTQSSYLVRAQCFAEEDATSVRAAKLDHRLHAEAAQHQKLGQIVGCEQAHQLLSVHDQGAAARLCHQRQDFRQVLARFEH